MTRRIPIPIVFILMLVAWYHCRAANRISPVPEQEALEIGVEAYIYGYPLVTMEMTRRVMTNVATPLATKAPMGQFASVRDYPDASFKDVPAPNADTLYSIAWVDLSKEAYVLHVPDEAGRYYLMPMLDGWTNVFASPGKRTTGTKVGDYLICGRHWKGVSPRGVAQYKSPTDMVWIIGRTYSTGTPEDFKEVHAIQDQYSLKPLSAYGKAYSPPKGKVDRNIDMKTSPRDQVNSMPAAAYFKLLAALMTKNPPSAADSPMIGKMGKVGIVPGRDFDMAKLPPAVAKALEQTTTTGLEQIQEETKRVGKRVNGWQMTLTGKYGTDYLFRAATTLVGLGANLPQDAIYPMTTTDGSGQRLNGAHKYVLHFDNGKLPPVNGFWSLTMYNAEYFFVENPLNRYTLSQRSKFNLNTDGSVDLYLQNEPPVENLRANWLPAPEGNFNLILRMYWPKEVVLKGSWEPPAMLPADR
jgi:hypothetical protein